MRTSKQFIFAIITSLLLFSCDSNDDNDINTECNSNFIAFTSTNYFPEMVKLF